jgi:hypothetical protein
MTKPLKHGELTAFARNIGKSFRVVQRWKNTGKLDEYIRPDGSVDIEAAAKNITGKLAPRQQAAANARWKKTKDKPQDETALKEYLKETLGDTENCDFSELQRRNELEKLLLARIKRAEIEKELVPVKKVMKDWGEIATATKAMLMNLPYRLAAIVATMDGETEIRNLLKAEIRHHLTAFAEGKNACPHCGKQLWDPDDESKI